MKNNKMNMIAALKRAIKEVEKFEATDRIIASITQYKTKEKVFVTDIHINN